MKQPIIIDTDPGIDDAAAISFALNHPEFDLKMISTVNGNVGIEKTTANALKLKRFFNSDIPVHRGASQPLLSDIVDASDVHGESGMEGYTFPEINESDLDSTHAVEAMRDVLLKSETPITLIPIGPLTNIALLLLTYPEVKTFIKEIVLMGGSASRGNVTSLAEFNIYCDPEAAQIVFNSGLPLTMIGLDVARSSSLTHDTINELNSINDTGKMLHQLFKHYRGDDFEKGINVYDAYTLLYLLHPEHFDVREADVQIETDGKLTKGASVVDFKSQFPNTTVVMSVQANIFKQMFIDALKYCK
ncbi:ribonucleoside hydrolase RihC [Staphylococcus cohnii]|uniref:Inosine-uridine preferring nucleoside hydrolase n=1 Tax=Staphylococcus cohnii subsp. cohnii TaxID=74704 RepID=A0A0M2NZG3_STACC|nr:ribonucleoside hydrolase RihC [Staphylococcus cohnii]TGP64337.1 ribonucleoside hydrolase RihC [bacterium M00.F.Ca.ET.229.01.1.1]TGS40488.1 ribonucleoside hydrolase RihC [bacterium M00.F.Ca.ET.180.01.1.1]KKI63355.1 Inosine-uridine preferring nucleoside hydrolase [Staphylococcus cohnii subsp. cohnii]OIS35095.1 nucleoside hydrolase [Staphylococcus cohnii]OIS38286.1 nucleoside hydrolase [Staphylococcus cohnii]